MNQEKAHIILEDSERQDLLVTVLLLVNYNK